MATDEGELALHCPFPTALHRDADSVQAQSVAWARRFHLLGRDERRYRGLQEARIGRLVARAFPAGERDGLQIAADWTTLFCLLDDKTEVAGTSMVRLASLLSRMLDAFRDGNAGDDAFAAALVDLRNRMLDAAGEAWLDGFGEQDAFPRTIYRGDGPRWNAACCRRGRDHAHGATRVAGRRSDHCLK